MNDSDWLDDAAISAMNAGHCPDCRARGFILGPRGGASVNIECANLACRKRFNMAQAPMSHRFIAGHRIPKEAEGGTKWQ